MAQAMVNFRMDSQLKNDMEKVCREMGLTPSVAYNLFEITADPFYSAQNMDRLNKAISDIKAGRNMSEHELIEAD